MRDLPVFGVVGLLCDLLVGEPFDFYAGVVFGVCKLGPRESELDFGVSGHWHGYEKRSLVGFLDS